MGTNELTAELMTAKQALQVAVNARRKVADENKMELAEVKKRHASARKIATKAVNAAGRRVASLETQSAIHAAEAVAEPTA